MFHQLKVLMLHSWARHYSHSASPHQVCTWELENNIVLGILKKCFGDKEFCVNCNVKKLVRNPSGVAGKLEVGEGHKYGICDPLSLSMYSDEFPGLSDSQIS